MKYALIGCGRIAKNHVKAALTNNFEIVAVCDIVPEKMNSILVDNGVEYEKDVKRYTDYKKMISENDIELISIATESGIHAEIALACIEKGINVIIEKPMAMSIEDCEKIIQLSEEKGVKVSACHQNRFNIAIQKLNIFLQSQRFQVLSIIKLKHKFLYIISQFLFYPANLKFKCFIVLQLKE